MKVVAIIDTHLKAGGGFVQALNAVLQMQRLSEGLFALEAVTPQAENIDFLRELGVTASVYRKTWRDKWVSSLYKRPSGRSFLARHKILSGLENHLLSSRTDLVYFVTPDSRFAKLKRLNSSLSGKTRILTGGFETARRASRQPPYMGIAEAIAGPRDLFFSHLPKNAVFRHTSLVVSDSNIILIRPLGLAAVDPPPTAAWPRPRGCAPAPPNSPAVADSQNPWPAEFRRRTHS